MDTDSPITARLIFWPVDRDAVWLKARFTPKMLAEMCHSGICPLEGFVADYGGAPCPVHDCTKDENVTAKDWIRFLSVGAPIGGHDEKR